mgnify:CR=1 FL=1|tara:strand:+ start:417 stop:767 length:351 start_codon:yes stop_codon:yes gene_type:complete
MKEGYSNNIIIDPRITDIAHSSRGAGFSDVDCIIFKFNNKTICVDRNEFYSGLELRVVCGEMHKLTKSFRDALANDISEVDLHKKLILTQSLIKSMALMIFGENPRGFVNLNLPND